MDIDYVKQMCCNLEQQQKKINETYDEIMNSLNLQQKIEELEDKLQIKEEELIESTNETKEYENKLKIKDMELKRYKNIMEDKENELKMIKSENEKIKSELDRVKKVGNIIINTHNQQFIKLLTNMNKLLEFIEYYTQNEEEGVEDNLSNSNVNDLEDLSSDNSTVYAINKTASEALSEVREELNEKSANDTNINNKSSLELLVDINSKFVKISINVMKLLSELDHETLNNYIKYTNFTENIDKYCQFMNMSADMGRNELKREDINGSNGYSFSNHNTNDNASESNYSTKSYNYQICNHYKHGKYNDGVSENRNYHYHYLNRSNHSTPSIKVTMSQLNNNKTRAFKRDSKPNKSDKSNNNCRLITETVYNSNKGSVKRIVTGFRPQFNSLFRPIPLNTAGNNSLNGRKGIVAYNNGIFQPIYSRNSRMSTRCTSDNSAHGRHNTSYASSNSSTSSMSLRRYKTHNEEVTSIVNRKEYLNIWNTSTNDSNIGLKEKNMGLKEGGVCSKDMEKGTQKLNPPEIESEYDTEELEGDEYYFKILDIESKQDKYSEDDTPIPRLISI